MTTPPVVAEVRSTPVEDDTVTLVRMTIYVPPALKRAVRIAAAVDEIPMSAWAAQALHVALPAFEPVARSAA